MKIKTVTLTVLLAFFALSGCSLVGSVPMEEGATIASAPSGEAHPLEEGGDGSPMKEPAAEPPAPDRAAAKPPVVAPGRAGRANPFGKKTPGTTAVADSLVTSPRPDLLLDPPEALDTAMAADGIRQEGTGLVLNFDHAGLSEVITAFTELLGINYMVLAELQGEVTIQTSGFLDRDDLFPLFYQILEANGLTAVAEKGLYKIVPIKEAARLLPEIHYDSPAAIPAAERGMVIQVVPLKYINAAEMGKILAPFISAEGSIISNEAARTLVIVDQRINLLKAMKLIETFDVDLFAKLKYRFLRPVNVVSKDILGPLTSFVELFNKTAREEIKLISLDKINSILVITPSERLLTRVTEFMAELDRPGQDVEPRIYIYFLKNSQAQEMATLLGGIFVGDLQSAPETQAAGEKPKKPAAEGGNPFAAKPHPAAAAAERPRTAAGDFGSGSLRGEVKITADEIRNALIVEAVPSDYKVIEKVLKRLDILPRQVLISVRVVEVQLDDQTDMGIEWTFNKVASGTTTPSFWSGAAGAAGLSYLIGETSEWNAAISALAQKKKVNILSSPSVLASDNKAAKINISTEIPVASAQIQYDDTSSSSNKTQTDIQYRNTGVILDVTPHINEYGLVSMEVNQEVSEQASSVAVGGSSYPSFFKRSISTTLTVDNGQTVVIGGLIRETKSNSDTGVPWLSTLPLVGWVFGKTGDSVSKTELVILITPKVVASLEDVDAVTREFSRKVGYDLKK